MATQTGDIRQLATLVEVSQTLASTLNLEAALHRVLEILEHHHSMVPSMVTLLHKESSALAIAAANGLPADGMQARYNVGEGITGRVVESGKPIPDGRLEAIPWAERTADEQERYEGR